MLNCGIRKTGTDSFLFITADRLVVKATTCEAKAKASTSEAKARTFEAKAKDLTFEAKARAFKAKD